MNRPAFLQIDWLLGCFSNNPSAAPMQYRQFVSYGREKSSPWDQVKNQIYLGSDDFVKQKQRIIHTKLSLDSIPKSQIREPIKPLQWFETTYNNRKVAMANAYSSGHYTLHAVGDYFGVSGATVSSAVKTKTIIRTYRKPQSRD